MIETVDCGTFKFNSGFLYIIGYTFEKESIGTSVTSSFATQEGLIDHLINHGESLNPVNTGRIKPDLRR